jgi:phospholipid transport system substrate-binding protein
MKSTYLLLAGALLLLASPAIAKTEMQSGKEKTAGIVAPRAPAKTVKPATEAGRASDVVRHFYSKLEAVMQQGQQLGFDGRYQQLKPVIEKSFNLPQMTRFAVGPNWIKSATDQQDRLVKAFADFSIANYANRFKKYSGEQFFVSGEKESVDGALIVETMLLPKDDKPVTLNYLMRKNDKGAWQITDVYLGATISELATRRSEFSAIVAREGVDALINTLEQKAQAMRAS